MKKVITALLFSFVAFASNAQDVQGNRVIAKKAFYLKNWWITDIQRDTNLTVNSSLPTSKAVRDFVAGRIAAVSVSGAVTDVRLIGRDFQFYRNGAWTTFATDTPVTLGPRLYKYYQLGLPYVDLKPDSALAYLGSGGGSSLWATSSNNIYNTNSGNVGIGTSSPTSNLHIKSNLGFAGALLEGLTGQEYSFRKTGDNYLSGGVGFVNGDNHLYFYNNRVSGDLSLNTYAGAMTLKAGGNFGIGTSDPQTLLDVNGVASAQRFQATVRLAASNGLNGDDQFNFDATTGNASLGDASGNFNNVVYSIDQTGGHSFRGKTFITSANENGPSLSVFPTTINDVDHYLKVFSGSQSTGYGFDYYNKDISGNDFGEVRINANPEEGIHLRSWGHGGTPQNALSISPNESKFDNRVIVKNELRLLDGNDNTIGSLFDDGGSASIILNDEQGNYPTVLSPGRMYATGDNTGNTIFNAYGLTKQVTMGAAEPSGDFNGTFFWYDGANGQITLQATDVLKLGPNQSNQVHINFSNLTTGIRSQTLPNRDGEYQVDHQFTFVNGDSNPITVDRAGMYLIKDGTGGISFLSPSISDGFTVTIINTTTSSVSITGGVLPKQIDVAGTTITSFTANSSYTLQCIGSSWYVTSYFIL